jgi:PAS domain S-box-containing protein
MPIQSFLQRLVWACLVPPFVLAVALAGARMHDRYQAELGVAQRLSANLLNNIDSLVQTRLDALQVLASLSSGPAALPLPLQYRQAQAFRTTYGSHVLLARLDRRMVYNTQRPLGSELPDVRALPGRSAWDAAVASGRPAVGDLFVGQVANASVVALAVPVMEGDRVTGLLMSIVSAAELQSVMDRWRLPPGIGLVLQDGAGQAIARRTAASASAEDHPAQGTQFRVDSALTGWRLAVSLDGSTVPSKLATEGAPLLVLLALTSVVVALVARQGARRLGQAVGSLAAPQAPAGRNQSAGELREIAEVRRRLDTLAAQRDAAEAGVRESESRLRRLLSALREPVWISIDRRLVFANPAAESLVGLDLDAMSRRPFLDWVDAASRRRLRTMLDRVRAGEVDVLVEDMVFPAAGPRRRTLRVTGVSLDLPNGQATLTMARDITELTQARGALERSHRELTGLVERINTVEEEERRRIARELHDDLQQRLGAIAVEQEQAELRLPDAARDSPAAAALARARAMTAEAIGSVRQIVRSLRPQALDELGPYAAIEALTREFGRTWRLQTDCEFIGPEEAERALPTAAATCLYRVAQEALNNVRKHARASFVHLSLDLSSPARATLTVTDDGQGIDPGSGPGAGRYGIRGMRERVRTFGGTLDIGPTPTGGTRLVARIAWLPAPPDA